MTLHITLAVQKEFRDLEAAAFVEPIQFVRRADAANHGIAMWEAAELLDSVAVLAGLGERRLRKVFEARAGACMQRR